MIADLKPYPEYKDSGLPWLGKVPGHWGSRRMKFLFKERAQKGFPNEPLLAATQSKGVVRKEDYGLRTVTAINGLENLKLVEVGDFVISLRSFQGGIEVSHARGIISPAYTVLRPRDDFEPRYFKSYFKSADFISSLTLFVTGIREGQNIDYERLSRAFMPLPPPTEQAAIVRFLDWANGRLERAIRAKRKVIALLNEQKQAIIHKAVTRGLDPNVPLKPSGIPWLGDIPRHWELAATRHRYSQCLGKMLDSKRITGSHSLPYLRNTNVQWDRIDVDDLHSMDITQAEYARYTLQPRDLLVCEGGEVGRCAIWSGELKLCGFQKALHRLRPLNLARDITRFMYYALNAAAKGGAFNDGHVSTIAHLTGDKLRAHRFGFPPLKEQEQIVTFLDSNLDRLNGATSVLLREIALLREYRTRLVADVVTGKLDVRKAAANLSDSVEDEVEQAVGAGVEEAESIEFEESVTHDGD